MISVVDRFAYGIRHPDQTGQIMKDGVKTKERNSQSGAETTTTKSESIPLRSMYFSKNYSKSAPKINISVSAR